MSGRRVTSFTGGKGVTDSKEWDEEDYEEESYDIDPDYLFAYDEDEQLYCEICHCSMSGPKSFEAHLAGARHKKNVKTSELGAPVRPARVEVPTLQMKDGRRVNWKPKCQAMIETFDKPLIGLQFVTEWCHRNRYVEPRYYCTICKAKCDVRMMTSHLTAVKHRIAYMKLFYPEMAAKVKEEERNKDQAPLAERYAKEIEKQEGRQPLRVKVEGFDNCEGDDDDKELEEYINANKQNFYRYLTTQGLSTSSKIWKSGGADDRHTEQPIMSSSGASQSFSGTGHSNIHSASNFGFDSVGPLGYQMSHPQKDFDSYQPQRSATSGSMSQSRPIYNEDSDCRRQLSPDYAGAHSSANYYGRPSGYTRRLDTAPGYQSRWNEDETGFDRDQFQPRNSSAVRPILSFPPSSDPPGPSYGTRGSRDSYRPYPANRPSRFSAPSELSEGHATHQSRY